jgi:hypothetical protein
MTPSTGKIIIIAGVLIVCVGIVVYFFGNRLGFIGRLPGDIRIERGNSSFYFPVTTCILLSLAITGIIRLIQWFLR